MIHDDFKLPGSVPELLGRATIARTVNLDTKNGSEIVKLVL